MAKHKAIVLLGLVTIAGVGRIAFSCHFFKQGSGKPSEQTNIAGKTEPIRSKTPQHTPPDLDYNGADLSALIGTSLGYSEDLSSKRTVSVPGIKTLAGFKIKPIAVNEPIVVGLSHVAEARQTLALDETITR